MHHQKIDPRQLIRHSQRSLGINCLNPACRHLHTFSDELDDTRGATRCSVVSPCLMVAQE
ncbi:hypothetical protein SynBIOSE41_01584 [Synechococcus sp. BIOS-E4-1]|nr:hypothetical protein SynBIOSE41_01584 [Synechococcus sp. BIOS-E4-1]